MSECDLARRSNGQPVSEYLWCRSHRRVVQACLSAKDARIAELEAALRLCVRHLEDTSVNAHDPGKLEMGFKCGAATAAREALWGAEPTSVSSAPSAPTSK